MCTWNVYQLIGKCAGEDYLHRCVADSGWEWKAREHQRFCINTEPIWAQLNCAAIAFHMKYMIRWKLLNDALKKSIYRALCMAMVVVVVVEAITINKVNMKIFCKNIPQFSVQTLLFFNGTDLMIERTPIAEIAQFTPKRIKREKRLVIFATHR